jgi:hypothetical protein
MVAAEDIPYSMTEEYEPSNIKNNSEEEKDSICPSKSLATTLNRNNSKEPYHQVDHKNPIEQCPK